MARAKHAVAPAAPRKTLLEWIEIDDGDQTSSTQPACDDKARALHARILVASKDREAPEPLPPPTGLRLAPLG